MSRRYGGFSHSFIHMFIRFLDRERLGARNKIANNKEMDPAHLVLV